MRIENFIMHIKQTVPDLELDLQDLSRICKVKEIKPGEHILKEGQICSSYYFLTKGALRIFINHDGREITNWFAFENYFFTELESYNLRVPTKYIIEAIEECEIILIERSDMEYLLSRNISWQEYLRKNWESAFIKLNEAMVSFQSKPAQERYDELFAYPRLLQRTKQKDLSGMIGITPYSLSRIRKNKRR